ALGCIATLAVFFPAELGKKADMFASAPAGIKPEWYFMAPYQMLKYLPAKVLGLDGDAFGIVAVSLVASVGVFIPFVDKRRPDGTYNPIWRWAAWGTIVFLVVFTYVGINS
ncbi:MAG: cytochrome bc complex cytochrome b subunit, partial [Gemmatimonadaceae bacterium]